MEMTEMPQGNRERIETVSAVLNDLPELDIAILGLRHLEQLTTSKAATETGVIIEAARDRYRAALRRIAAATSPVG